MACTRVSASRRILNAYLQELDRNSDYGLQITIGDTLTEEAIAAQVQDHDLLREHDYSPEAVVPFEDRDMQLLASWLSSQPVGRVH
jgi:hypothetical protein